VEEVHPVDACQELDSPLVRRVRNLNLQGVLIKCLTSSQLSFLYSLSSVPMIRQSFSPRPRRKSGHSAGH
jgi:hypothetical protein